ncbi:MAG TPA: molybdopterin cofactor-binding domain-containing protein, partial [Rhodocyclaceae bacterium]|nr:molybdopterin cofactor-binding domain-containing protein [Rhodocyclaceae bacterium]
AILTVEGLSKTGELHPLQAAFMETGAIQCGYCTPGMLLAARSLLDRERNPDLAQARQALGSILCRCTGYTKPVEAVLRAAAVLRGEAVPPLDAPPAEAHPLFNPPAGPPLPEAGADGAGVIAAPRTATRPEVRTAPGGVVGASKQKVDALRLAKGHAAFTDDFRLPGMLYGELLTSPHAHARIRSIDTSKAKALPGVHAVLTYQDLPRVIFAPGCQSYPNPKPYDQVSLDSKVRYIGDKVAVVAAETPEIARAALELIEVDYEILPAVFEAEAALAEGAPVIHDEPDAVGIQDAARNLVVTIKANVGDVEKGLAVSAHVFERTYHLQQVQQTPIEPHVTVTYWDEDERLVVRTGTQAPFHMRRVLAPVLGLPIGRIRVIKPRMGGGFGGKMDVILEDLCAHLTVRTGRPVRMEFSREQEFLNGRSRHPAAITYRVGVDADGNLQAIDMRVVENTGAYGVQGMTVVNLIGARGLSTYRSPNIRFDSQVAYTNLPVPSAFRGFGGPQAQFAMESMMDEIAAELGLDPVAFRLQNAIRQGDEIAIMALLGEGGPVAQIVPSSRLPECVAQGAAAIDWERSRDPAWKVDPARSNIRRGLGMCVLMHGTAIPGLDMGGAVVKLNDDGSFNLLIGAADLGTGSDTVLAQMAAEVLGVPLEKIYVLSSDTDLTPFDVGAYASSTTYISGMAVRKAAEQARQKLFERAALMLKITADGMAARDERIYAADGRSVTLAEIGLHSLHILDQEQIMGSASHTSMVSPPSFGSQFAEVEVDVETGEVRVVRLVLAVDCGTVINPQTATGQMEGGMAQALGYAVSEEMVYDEGGRLLTTRFGDYHIFQAEEMPELVSILVPSYEQSGPFGAKGLGEIVAEGVAPAVANAVFHATGRRLRALPLTPEKVWRALKSQAAPSLSKRTVP